MMHYLLMQARVAVSTLARHCLLFTQEGFALSYATDDLQEDLDDLLRYGATELFADENGPADEGQLAKDSAAGELPAATPDQCSDRQLTPAASDVKDDPMPSPIPGFLGAAPQDNPLNLTPADIIAGQREKLAGSQAKEDKSVPQVQIAGTRTEGGDGGPGMARLAAREAAAGRLGGDAGRRIVYDDAAIERLLDRCTPAA